MERDPVAPFPSPPLLCACHAGYIPSQYFQWCIPWYIIQANSHVMYWLFWQLSKTSGWNFLVFPYYALPSKDLHNLRSTIIVIMILLWLFSYRLASILYIAFKKRLRESHLVFLNNHVFEVLFVCLLVFASFIFYKFRACTLTHDQAGWDLLCLLFQPNAVTFNVVLFSFPSSTQKAVEKLKVVMHHQPPAVQAKTVIFWWPTMPQIQLMLNSSWVGKETG